MPAEHSSQSVPAPIDNGGGQPEDEHRIETKAPTEAEPNGVAEMPETADDTKPQVPPVPLPKQDDLIDANNQAATIGPALSSETPARLIQLYKLHAKRQQQLKLQRQREEEHEMQKIRDEREGARLGTRRAWKPKHEDPTAIGQRLYENHATVLEHLQELQSKLLHEENQKLLEARDQAMPTRKGVDMTNASIAAASVRLYSDAERRERERTSNKALASDRDVSPSKVKITGKTSNVNVHAGDGDVSPAKGKGSSKTSNVNLDRLEHLYGDAQERQKRLIRKREEAAEAELRECVQFKAPTKQGASYTGGRQRLEELYQHGGEFQKKIQRERQRILDEYARLSSPKRSRSPGPQPATSAAISASMPPIPSMPQAECLLEAVITGIQTRCGYTDIFPQGIEKRAILEPLTAAMMKYKEAFSECEKSDGFAALQCRASQRLFFGGYLVPEFEGISRCAQPDPVRQVEEDLEALLASAQQAQEILKELIAPRARWATGDAHSHPKGCPVAMIAVDPGVKTARAATMKALAQFAPSEGSRRYRHLLDLARVGLVFSNCDMLQSGLDHIMRCSPEVVYVRNRFLSPSRLGGRWVEMGLVIQVVKNGRAIPHVCELRLEELSMHKARMEAEEDLDRFYSAIRRTYDRASREFDAVAYVAQSIIFKPSNNQNSRTFRCNLSRRFGSTVASWRHLFAGSGRQLNFQRFRDACQVFKCRQCVTELWQELDPGLAGTISLFEIDPDAVSLLIRLRARIVALSPAAEKNGDSDADMLFARLTFHMRIARAGQLDAQEFRSVLKPLGFSVEEADKAFSYLDYHGAAPSVNKLDLLWLKKLPQLVDVSAISLSSVSQPSEEEYFRHVIESCQSVRRGRRASKCAAVSNCSDNEAEMMEQLSEEQIARRSSFQNLPQKAAAAEAEKADATTQMQCVPASQDHMCDDMLSIKCSASVNGTETICNGTNKLQDPGDNTFQSSNRQNSQAPAPDDTKLLVDDQSQQNKVCDDQVYENQVCNDQVCDNQVDHANH